MALSPAKRIPLSPANPNKAMSPSIASLKAQAAGVSKASTPSPGRNTPVVAVEDDSAPKDISEQLNETIRKKYKKGKKLGEGTYAVVYEGHLVTDPTHLVAIKKIKVQAEFKDGLAMDAIREMRCLQELSHPNIIKLHAVFSTKDQNLNLVLEHLPQGDLEKLMQDLDHIKYGLPEIKAWMAMLMRGVHFIHSHAILHRDIKLNNLLIAADGSVKLADFGLARSFADPRAPMTYNVITRWYRPPELFFAARHYGGAVDIWSCGVVFGELALRRFWMPSETDVGHLALIADIFGSPTEENWPGVSSLDGYIPVAKDALKPPRSNAEYWAPNFGTLGPRGIDLLKQMMTLDPRRRATARAVLEHPWWSMEPRPTALKDLPRRGGGPGAMGDDLKRRGGELDTAGRADKVARKLDFGGMR